MSYTSLMDIVVTTGKGTGKTPLSAFDAALKDAGVHNYNLIILSSIIPPKTTIKVQKYLTPKSEYGNRLYVVKAEIRSGKSGQYVGAAVGWHQLPDGRGVFVEHETVGETEAAVTAGLKSDVKHSVMDLCRSRKFPVNESKIKMAISVTEVKDLPASALVLAVYKSERWT